MVIDRECRCPAFPWPHEFGVSDCGDRLARRDADPDTGDDYTLDHAADDPQRGQSAGLNDLRRVPE